MAPTNVTVWFEIPVTDMKKASAFYEKVLNTKLIQDDTGPNPMAIFPTADDNGAGGHLYPGKPAGAGTGNTVHLATPDAKLEDALGRVEPAGGKVLSPIIEIPTGRFAYCLDPDGNSIGLFGN